VPLVAKKKRHLPPPPEVPLLKNERQDQLAHKFGKMLATSLKEIPIRDFIKSEASLKFDGDYDILFALSKDKPMEGYTNARGESLTFGQALRESAALQRIDMREFDELMLDIQREYPLMQIAVPELDNMAIENWNTITYKPIVAILDSDVDEATTDYITGYNEFGQIVTLSLNDEPEELTIVISPNERIVALEPEIIQPCLLDKTQVLVNEYYHFYTITDYIDCTIDNPYVEPVSVSCTRENLYLLKFDKKALKQVEVWPHGAPEIHIWRYKLESNNSSSRLKNEKYIDLGCHEPTKRGFIMSNWWPIKDSRGVNMFSWTTAPEQAYAVWFWEFDGFPIWPEPSSPNKRCVQDMPLDPVKSDWFCVERKHDVIGLFKFLTSDKGECGIEKYRRIEVYRDNNLNMRYYFHITSRLK
jgi:hypothetical protein